MGIERLNQYAGLFGAFLVRDDAEDALRLPSGAHEIPLVLCDRLFDADGQLRYPTSGYRRRALGLGSPRRRAPRQRQALSVPRGRASALPLPSDQRVQRAPLLPLALRRPPACVQIGTDQGLLPAPVPLSSLTLAPAERADLVVDFSERRRTGRSPCSSQTQPSSRVPRAAARRRPRRRRPRCPARLRPSPGSRQSSAAKTRVLTLNEYKDRAAAPDADAAQRDVLARPGHGEAGARQRRDLELPQH